jgi:signal transduction histidine kinase
VPVGMGIHLLTGESGGLHSIPGQIVGVVLVFYGLGAYALPRRSAWALCLALPLFALNSLMQPGGGVTTAAPGVLFGVLLPYTLGRVVQARDAREHRSQDAAERIDASREGQARAAAYTERARLARELHDIVAHHVSVMVLHAGGARLVMDDDPEKAELSLRHVERAGRQALTEMRRLLGVPGGGAPQPLAPPPGLALLPSLFDHARSSGVAAELQVDGAPRPVSAALDLCAYRIVQEALTNVIKHAAPGPAYVTVRWGGQLLELEVADDGRRHASKHVGGHGIVGMRERAALHGGTVEVGPRPEGGFRVRAYLPLSGSPA